MIRGSWARKKRRRASAALFAWDFCPFVRKVRFGLLTCCWTARFPWTQAYGMGRPRNWAHTMRGWPNVLRMSCRCFGRVCSLTWPDLRYIPIPQLVRRQRQSSFRKVGRVEITRKDTFLVRECDLCSKIKQNFLLHQFIHSKKLLNRAYISYFERDVLPNHK